MAALLDGWTDGRTDGPGVSSSLLPVNLSLVFRVFTVLYCSSDCSARSLVSLRFFLSLYHLFWLGRVFIYGSAYDYPQSPHRCND
ncbi:hypothetical protein B0T24DRAFT_621625 [Lasiosphaeria ovina]|uniref:Uncharacterized protein n=1 Tax=Lasiosphaeria ovina TaxID=92902 RepID=A0AAE0KA32_9PEZI|nr:hypothetical protein B0T24DRAFT_621625 [Lasiosphaeria ovina]